MKKVAIVTIYGNDNFGNKLQNYALQEILKKMGFNPKTIKNDGRTNNKDSFFIMSLKIVKNQLYKIKTLINDIENNSLQRRIQFKKFDKKINKTFFTRVPSKKLGKEFDYFIAGSDQIWKPTYDRMRDMDLLNFTDNKKKISYAASIGVSSLEAKELKKLSDSVINYKKISVREDSGKRILEFSTNRKDIEVLIDPTLLLSKNEWERIIIKPTSIPKKYVLIYFLGKISDSQRKIIYDYVKRNECEIINIMDKNSQYYQIGPGQFLYLENNAEVIFTDSFHSCVFAFLFNKPFIVFKREGNSPDMYSRIETLLNKFQLKDREFNGKEITMNNIKVNYNDSLVILDKEREKADAFLRDALDIKK